MRPPSPSSKSSGSPESICSSSVRSSPGLREQDLPERRQLRPGGGERVPRPAAPRWRPGRPRAACPVRTLPARRPDEVVGCVRRRLERLQLVPAGRKGTPPKRDRCALALRRTTAAFLPSRSSGHSRKGAAACVDRTSRSRASALASAAAARRIAAVSSASVGGDGGSGGTAVAAASRRPRNASTSSAVLDASSPNSAVLDPAHARGS